MTSFKQTVLIVAIILLIVSLIIIGIIMSKAKSKEQFPPIRGSCPDYWIDVADKDKKTSKCVNDQNLGDPKCDQTMDFSIHRWTGVQGACNKQKWARSCNLTWDGITNNHELCK
jgi:hypothetical protein